MYANKLALLRASDFRLPDEICTASPGLACQLEEGFTEALPSGVPASLHQKVVAVVEQLFRFELAAERGGWFTAKTLKESELQGRLRDHLRSAGMEVAEGEEVGGGETDLVATGSIVIENKVHGPTKEPLRTTHKYEHQARRYSVAICERVYIVCMAYKCEKESTMLPIP